MAAKSSLGKLKFDDFKQAYIKASNHTASDDLTSEINVINDNGFIKERTTRI